METQKQHFNASEGREYWSIHFEILSSKQITIEQYWELFQYLENKIDEYTLINK
jgi:hypothetical protein